MARHRFDYTVVKTEELVTLANAAQFPRMATVAVKWQEGVRPTVILELEARNGRPELSLLGMRRVQDGREVTGRDLRELPLEEVVREAIQSVHAHLVMEEAARVGPDKTDVLSYMRNRDGSVAARKYRSVNDDLLRRVAAIYGNDETGSPTMAVAGELATGHRNATRWVAMARQRGFLPPYLRQT